ncbi:Bcr/CflA family efflux MFS transporter [Avibacterium endocarditidis]|uniref:Bcr/CflA family efflux MFS transporter n=1 Tax=Avibacterium TaxID=292486 RepID=UPI0039FCCE74
MAIFTIGSIGCALSGDMHHIMFWRVFQAFGACTAPMLSRAMVRDIYSEQEAARMLSTLLIMMAIAPILGPLIGGQLLKLGSLHYHFIFLAVIGFLLFLSIFRLPETLPAEKRIKRNPLQMLKNYAALLGQKNFMSYTLCITFFNVAIYAFITGSPFVYIEYFHIPEQYFGFLFGANIVGVIVMSMFNRKLVMRYPVAKLVKLSGLIAVIATVLLAICAKNDLFGIAGIFLPVLAFFSMNGILIAGTTAAALNSVQGDNVGSAAAMMGSLQYGSGIVSSLMLAAFSDGTPFTMAWIILLFTVLSLAMGGWGGSQTKIKKLH